MANGLDALWLAFRVLGIGKGDEVIVQGNTYIASVMGITINDATPVFVEPNEYYSFYQCNGYQKKYYNNWQPSTKNKNSYPDSPQPYFYQYGNRAYCNNINCMVYLNKGDKLQLFGIHREYHDEWLQSVTYQTSATVRVSIEAASPKSYNELKASGFGYNTPSDFSTNLKLSEFLNKETKISEWIQSVADAFNFEIWVARALIAALISSVSYTSPFAFVNLGVYPFSIL